MDAERCRQVIQTCFPTFTVHSIAFLAEGWGSTVWEVNGSHVFRFPKRPEIIPGLRKEIGLLRQRPAWVGLPSLCSALPLPVPSFDFVWLGGPNYAEPFVGYPKIPGVPLLPQNPPLAGLAEPARQLGEFLTALHCFPVSSAVALGIPMASAATWREEYEALYQAVRQRVLPPLPRPQRQNLSAGWEDFLEDEANFRFTPALIHRDLSGEHILFDTAQGCITGIIDWEDASIGDPAFDFTGMLDYGPDFVQGILGAYSGPAAVGTLARARFYHAIAPCHEVLFGLDYGLPQHVANGLEALRAAWLPSNR